MQWKRLFTDLNLRDVWRMQESDASLLSKLRKNTHKSGFSIKPINQALRRTQNKFVGHLFYSWKENSIIYPFQMIHAFFLLLDIKYKLQVKIMTRNVSVYLQNKKKLENFFFRLCQRTGLSWGHSFWLPRATKLENQNFTKLDLSMAISRQFFFSAPVVCIRSNQS